MLIKLPSSFEFILASNCLILFGFIPKEKKTLYFWTSFYQTFLNESPKKYSISIRISLSFWFWKKKKIRNFFAFFLFTVVSKFSFGFLYFCAKQVQHFVCLYFPTSFHFISDLFSFFSFFFLSSEITGGVVKNQFFILTILYFENWIQSF